MFSSLFKPKGPLTPEEFRQKVLKIARKLVPGKEIGVPEDDPEILEISGTKMVLGNLHAKFELSGRSEKALKMMVAQHLQLLSELPDIGADFESSQANIRVQLGSRARLEPPVCVKVPFGETLSLYAVYDAGKMIRYLTEDDAQKWGKTFEELIEIGIKNLTSASKGIEMQFQNQPEVGLKMLLIASGDSFDASRAAAPRLRELAAERLGSPFYFGIPNRDILICWNADAPQAVSQNLAAKIASDYQEQPYALSPYIFETAFDGQVKEFTEGL